MTWGSSASFAPTRCRFCGIRDIDDRDAGPSSHEIACYRRPWWHRLLFRGRKWRA